MSGATIRRHCRRRRAWWRRIRHELRGSAGLEGRSDGEASSGQLSLAAGMKAVRGPRSSLSTATPQDAKDGPLAISFRFVGFDHHPGKLTCRTRGDGENRQGPVVPRGTGGARAAPVPWRFMSTNQILVGVGLIFVLAVGSQVLAALRVPALIIMLPAGFVAGAITSDVNPARLLGPAFEPVVSLAVAVILYDAGLGDNGIGVRIAPDQSVRQPESNRARCRAEHGSRAADCPGAGRPGRRLRVASRLPGGHWAGGSGG